ncbi:MAG TPA: hypothetical protein PLN12_15025 [Flavobacteriales bacterium]|nr:hypothetical protein [Flavobacteriales bacterium]
MPRIIARDKVSEAMRHAWDRLVKADQRLEKYKQDRVGDRDQFVDEHSNALQAYRRQCRSEGYIGSNGRTQPPHLDYLHT